MPVELRLFQVEREKSTIEFYGKINRVYFLGIQQFSATLQASKRAAQTPPNAVTAIKALKHNNKDFRVLTKDSKHYFK